MLQKKIQPLHLCTKVRQGVSLQERGSNWIDSTISEASLLLNRRSLLPAATLMLVLAAIPPFLKGQGGGIGNTTSTPVAGVPHDYIAGLNETVNPANGAGSVRIAQDKPHERGQNWPSYAFIYDSNGVFQLQPYWFTGCTPALTYLNTLTYYAIPGASFQRELGGQKGRFLFYPNGHGHSNACAPLKEV